MTDLSISLAEYHRMQADSMLELELQMLIIRAAEARGWLAYHTYDSRKSAPGFPDLVLVNAKQRRTLWRELKRQNGRTTSDQKKWLAALESSGHDVDVWRPIHWFDGTVLRALEPPMPDVAAWAATVGITLSDRQLDYAREAFVTDHPIFTQLRADDFHGRRRLIQHLASIHPTEGEAR